MKRVLGFFLLCLSLAAGLSMVPAQKTEPPKLEKGDPLPPKPKKHGRGYKRPPKEQRRLMYALSNAANKKLKASIPTVTLATYDARPTTAGGNSCVPAVGDQGSCGDCYMWSGCKAQSACLMTNGIVPADGKFFLAPSYGLDCQNLGGCGGGDEYQVAQVVVSSGWPSLAAYGGDGQNPRNCKSTAGMTLYKVDTIVMVGSQDGVAATQDIKNFVYQSGYVSVAADASDWDNVGPNTTITGSGTSIDHAIGICGWDDTHDNGDNSKGAWIMQNNWSTTWGGNCGNPSATGGYAWVKYGADSLGTEAFVGWNNSQKVIPFPPVTPPPPVPAGAPVITVAPQTVAVNAAWMYQPYATGMPTSWAASNLPCGCVINATSGLISGTPTTAGVYTATVTATNATGTGTASLQVTVGSAPVPSSNVTQAVITFADGSTQTLTAIPAGSVIVSATDAAALLKMASDIQQKAKQKEKP